jgi:DNA-directed RNA polymerase specialized sigma24 family protein
VIPRERRWLLVIGYRKRLLALAASKGAGPDTEDVVHEALLRAVSFERLDEQRAWPFLAAVTVRLVVDHHRRSARDHALSHHAGLTAVPLTFEDDLADRYEALDAARLLAQLAPPEVARIVRRRADGASWQQLAAEYGETARALETRTRRTLLAIRCRIIRWRC